MFYNECLSLSSLMRKDRLEDCQAVQPGTLFSQLLAQAWRLLAIFLGTIVGIITKPLPLGAVAMLGLGATMLTKTLTFAAAFSAFASEIP